MLVSLKILPLVVRSDGIQLHFSVGESSGSWSYTYEQLLQAGLNSTPFVVRLQPTEPKLPNAKRVKRASMAQEEEVASDMGGHRQRGSGAVAWKKSDGRVRGKYRIENKLKMVKSITITREELDKVRSECSPGEVPLFEVDFANRATLKIEDRWILVPYEEWKKVSGGATADDR